MVRTDEGTPGEQLRGEVSTLWIVSTDKIWLFVNTFIILLLLEALYDLLRTVLSTR